MFCIQKFSSYLPDWIEMVSSNLPDVYYFTIENNVFHTHLVEHFNFLRFVFHEPLNYELSSACCSYFSKAVVDYARNESLNGILLYTNNKNLAFQLTGERSVLHMTTFEGHVIEFKTHAFAKTQKLYQNIRNQIQSLHAQHIFFHSLPFEKSDFFHRFHIHYHGFNGILSCNIERDHRVKISLFQFNSNIASEPRCVFTAQVKCIASILKCLEHEVLPLAFRLARLPRLFSPSRYFFEFYFRALRDIFINPPFERLYRLALLMHPAQMIERICASHTKRLEMAVIIKEESGVSVDMGLFGLDAHFIPFDRR